MLHWAKNSRRLLAVFAHPDDETFRPGGTLALLAQSGIWVQSITATRGEAGSRGVPPLCPTEELPTKRENELRCACRTLGIQPPRLLDYQDGSLAQVDPEKLVAEIVAIAHAVQPQVMLSFGPDGLSGHPDHIAIGRCALEAYRCSQGVAALYNVAVPLSIAQKMDMRHVRPVPDAEIALSVDVSPAWETKLAAIRCHATQLSSTPLLHASDERQRLFFGREYFVKCAERSPEENFLPVVLKDYLV